MSYLYTTIEYLNYIFDTCGFINIAENNENIRLCINEKYSPLYQRKIFRVFYFSFVLKYF